MKTTFNYAKLVFSKFFQLKLVLTNNDETISVMFQLKLELIKLDKIFSIINGFSS